MVPVMALSLRMRFCREERLATDGDMEPVRPWLGRLMVITFPVVELQEIPIHGAEVEVVEQGLLPTHDEERSRG